MINISKGGKVFALILIAVACLTALFTHGNEEGFDLDINVSVDSDYDNLTDYCRGTRYNVSACENMVNQTRITLQTVEGVKT